MARPDPQAPAAIPWSAAPSPWPWVAAAAAAAFLAGSLFQGYTRTGVGFFRMFATLSVVLAGYAATRALVAARLAAGLEVVTGQLYGLPAGWAIGGPLAVPGRPRAAADAVVLGRRTLFLLAFDDSGPLARPGAIRARQRAVARGLAALRERLAPALGVPVRTRLVIVPLARPRAGETDEADEATVVDADRLAASLLALDGAGGQDQADLEPETRTRLIRQLHLAPVEGSPAVGPGPR